MTADSSSDAGAKAINLTFMLYFFKVVVLLLFVFACVYQYRVIHQRRSDLNTTINQAQQAIKHLKPLVDKCTHYSTLQSKISPAECAAYQRDIEVQGGKIYPAQLKLDHFTNRYSFPTVYIPGIMAGLCLLLSMLVRPAALLAMLSCLPALSSATVVNIGWALVIIFAAFMSFYGDGYELIMVPQQLPDDSQEASGDQ
jgi:hypothetical protein